MQELQRGYVFEGKYRIQGELGRGGFGMVYLAYQLGMDRHVALKVLNPNMGENAARTAHERFLREVKIISKLRHPNTVTIHDFGETTDGLVYMVLEYVDGETLKSLLNRRGALDDARAIHIAMQIAKSLSEAHRHGIIHRDLKPANIMLSELGGETDFVKVLDFGIAQLRNKKKDQDLTSDGADGRQLIGTPRYMSPEQVRGEQLTGASDVYSLGLILYEMLTGERAVQGDTTMALITQQISPEPLRLGNLSRMHPKLQHITMRAVAKPTQSRYRTVDVMAQELEQALLEVKREALPGAASSSNDFLLGNQYDHYGSGSHPQVNQWGHPQQGQIRTTGSMDAVPRPHGGFNQPQQQPYSSGQYIGQNQAPYSGNYPQQQMPGQPMPGHPHQTGPHHPVHPSGPAQQASFVASHSYQQQGQHWGASEDPTPPPFAMGNQTPAHPGSGFNPPPTGPQTEPSIASLAPDLPAPPNRFAESNFAPDPTLEPVEEEPPKRERPGRSHHAKAESSGDTLSFLFNIVAICVLLPALAFAFYVSFITMGASVSLLLKGGSLRLIVTAVAAIAIPIVPLVAEGGRRERFKVVYSGLLKARRALTIGVIINLGSCLLLCFAFSEHIVYELKTTPNWFMSDEDAAREDGFPAQNKRFSKILADNIETSMLAAGMYNTQKASRQGGAGQPAMPLPTRPTTKTDPDGKPGKAVKKDKGSKTQPATRKPTPRSTMPAPTRPSTRNRKQRDTSKIKPVKDRSTSTDTKKKDTKDDGEYVDW